MTTLTTVSAAGVLEERVSQLAEPVRQKYRMLEDDRHDASDAVDGTARRLEAAREPTYRARLAATAAADKDRHNMDRIARQRHSGRPEPPSPEVEATAARLAQALDVERARRAAHDEAVHRFSVAQRLLAGVQDLLHRTDATALPPILLTRRRTPTTPTDVGADLAHLRDGIAEVVREREALARAPVSHVEAAARLDDFLDGAARQFDPATSYFTAPSYTAPSLDDLLPYKLFVLLAALPEVRAAFHEKLAKAYEKQVASVPSKDRPARAADLASRLRQLELQEELLVLEAEQAGHVIQRRPDADPLVVLTSVLAQ
jgi:hypothetical protein